MQTCTKQIAAYLGSIEINSISLPDHDHYYWAARRALSAEMIPSKRGFHSQRYQRLPQVYLWTLTASGMRACSPRRLWRYVDTKRFHSAMLTGFRCQRPSRTTSRPSDLFYSEGATQREELAGKERTKLFTAALSHLEPSVAPEK